MAFSFPLIAFSTFLSIISPSYFYFLLASIPTGIGWGASGPIGGIHTQLVEKKFKKIVTPYYAMGFSIGMHVGGTLAGFILRNNSFVIFFQNRNFFFKFFLFFHADLGWCIQFP